MIKDSVYTLLTRTLIILMKFVYSIVINRALGPTLKGAFELIQLAPDTLTRFGNLGFDQANTYFAGRKPEGIPRLISNSYRLILYFAPPAMLLGAGYMLLPQNRNIFQHVPLGVGFLALIIIPIAILEMLLEGILYGENRIWVRNIRDILRGFTALLFTGILVVGLHMAVGGAVYGYILVVLSIFSFTLFVLRRFHGLSGEKPDPGLAMECFRFGRFNWGANFASYLFYNVDKWLINALLMLPADEKLEQVGLYGMAVNIVVNIWIIPDAIQTALLPKITQKGESERKKLVPPSLRAVTFLVVLAIIALALIAKPALGFLYNVKGRNWDYTQSYTPLMLLMPGIFTLSLAKVFTADLFSRGKPYYAMWVSITSLVLNVILNVLMIPIPKTTTVHGLWIGGMNGAAIASSISYTFSFLMFLYFYIRESGERSRDIFLPKRSDFTLIFSWLRESWRRIMNSGAGDKGEGK